MVWHQVWVVEKYVWLEGMCLVGGYVWLMCVVDGCGQLPIRRGGIGVSFDTP